MFKGRPAFPRLSNPLDNPPLFPHIPRPMLSVFINILLTIHVVVSLLIIFIVLMQRPKSEGLGAAFGGGMTENLFGAQTSNVLASFTRVLGGIFFVLTLILSILYAKQSTQHSAIQAAAIKAAESSAASASPSLTGTALPPSSSIKAPAMNLTVPPTTSSTANTLFPTPTQAATPTPSPAPVSSGTISGH